MFQKDQQHSRAEWRKLLHCSVFVVNFEESLHVDLVYIAHFKQLLHIALENT